MTQLETNIINYSNYEFHPHDYVQSYCLHWLLQGLTKAITANEEPKHRTYFCKVFHIFHITLWGRASIYIFQAVRMTIYYVLWFVFLSVSRVCVSA